MTFPGSDWLYYAEQIEVQWWRHQMETFSALLAICAGNSPVPGESPHKGQWRGALMFPLICARINGWVNHGEAGDLRRILPHYDVTVMSFGDMGLAWVELAVCTLWTVIKFNVDTSLGWSQQPLLLTWLTLIPAWISNRMPGKVWGEITYQFLNFNGATV